MKPRRLVELAVVYPLLGFALLLIVLVAAMPRCNCRFRASETAAIATLRNLQSAQRVFVDARTVDLDGDGIGEFGTLGELTGSDPLRGDPNGALLEPPLLTPGLRPTGIHGTAFRSGYHYRLFFPCRDGRWLRVDESPEKRDVNAAETRWCVFAWPRFQDPRTTRSFRIDQTGRVTATRARVDPTVLPRLDVSGWDEVR